MRKDKETDLLEMDPGQEDFIRLLREKAEDTPVPMALEPSMMMARLEAQTAKKKTPWLKILSPVAMAVTACFALVLAGRSGGLDATVPAVSTAPPSSQVESSSELSSGIGPEVSSEPSSELTDVSESGGSEPASEVSGVSSEPAVDTIPPDVSGPSGETAAGPADAGESGTASPAEEAGEDAVEESSVGMGGYVPIGVDGYSPKMDDDNPYLSAYRAMQAAAAPDNAVSRYATGVLSAGISADGLQLSDEKSIICEGDGYFYISRQNSTEVSVVSARGAHNTFTVEFETPSYTGLTVESTAITHCESINGRLFVAGTVTYSRGGAAARTVSAMTAYDLSDPIRPKLIGKAAQDGTMLGLKEKDGYLYLFSRYYPDAAAPDNYPEAYVPFYYDDEARLADAGDVVISECRTESYVVVSSFSSKDPGSICDSLVLQGGGKNYYLGKEGLYLFGESHDEKGVVTQISALQCSSGSIRLAGEVTVPGIMNYSDSPDEYAGTLRILTNTYGVSNNTSLFIFDRQLNLLGSKENLVENQILRSVRFERSKLYFSLYDDRTATYALDLLIPQSLGEVYRAERSEEALQVVNVSGERSLRLSGMLGRDALNLTLKKGRDLLDTVTIPLTGTYSENRIVLETFDQGRYAALTYTDSGSQKQIVRLYALTDNTIRELLAYDVGLWCGGVRAYVQNGKFYTVTIVETAEFDLATGKYLRSSPY